jgi:hypothetical protein
LAITSLLFAACSSIAPTDDGAAQPAVVPTQPPAPATVTLPGTDLWIMGIEVNQGFTNQIFTDLNRLPGEIGSVTGSQSASVPVFAGKPMVIRVYVGLRNQLRMPRSGIDVTGHLLAIKDGKESSFQPLDNVNCSDFLGNSGPANNQACSSTIQVYPSLGRLGFNTRTNYDLDLMDERSHWEGTLNFVIPASFTADLKNEPTLQADVEPVNGRKPTPGDNTFTLQMTNILPPQVLSLRLVRVRTADPEPSLADAQRALSDMIQMTPFSQVNIVSDQVFPYNGDNLKLNFGLPEINNLLGVSNLDQAESLWLTLVQNFKPQSDFILLALTPAGTSVDGAEGMGMWIPPNSTGLTGGVSFSRMPAYAGNSSQDWERLTSMAQELYHAQFNRRHVSNSHGEGEGCFFSGHISLFIKVFSLNTINPNCTTPAPYPNGAIGAYPELKTADSQVMGDQGGAGVKLLQNGTSWDLVLYDPCPIGPVPRDPVLGTPTGDPAEFFSQRIPGCQLPDNRVPHDFMSYGAYRWTTWEQLFDAKFTPN